MFTIVIPCKNENQGLVKTINTIPKEIPIIVADSSTDNTLELLHGDIKITEGGLPAIARNNGAKEVTSPYILFLDADMDISKVPLNEIIKDVVSNDYHLVTTKILVKGNNRIFYELFYFLQKLISFNTPFAVGGFMLFNRDKFNALGGFNINDKFAEDYHLSMKISPRKFKIYKYPAFTSDRRLKRKGLFYMIGLMWSCFLNRDDDAFYTKDYNYWK